MANPIKEFREFFLRHIKVNTGPVPDQEVNYPNQYLVNGVQRYNRFLKNDVPSQDIYAKLFRSITFKLNLEDTAKTNEQGLVKISLDQDAYDRKSAANGAMRAVVEPHQLTELIDNSIIAFSFQGDINIANPDISNITGFTSEDQFVIGSIIDNPNFPSGTVINYITYSPLTLTLSNNGLANAPASTIFIIGTDTQISSVTRGGIILSTLKRLSSPSSSKFRKVFNIKIAIIYSLIIDSFGRLSLKGDVASPGYHMLYGTPKISTDPTARGWYDRNPTVTITTINGIGSPIVIAASGTVNVITHTVTGTAGTSEPLIEIDYDMNFEDHTGGGFNFVIFQAIDNITAPIAFDKVVKNLTNINGFVTVSGKITVKNVLVGKTIQIKVQNQSITNNIRVEYTKQVKIYN